MGTITHVDADTLSIPKKVTKAEWKASTTHLDSQSNTLELARSATITVAANDSASKSKAGADYVCDGVADDVQIQAAMDALPAAGGSIYLAEGNYALSAVLTPPSNCWLYGAKSAVINGAAAQPFLIDGKTNVTLEGITIDGDYGDAILLLGACTDILLQDLELKNMTQSGIQLYPISVTMERITIRNVYSHDNGHSGIYGVSNGGVVSDLLIDGCRCITCGSATGEWHGGIIIERFIAGTSIKVTNCYVEDSYESGVHFETIDGLVQVENTISKGNGARKAGASYAAGFHISKTNIICTNCIALENVKNGFASSLSETYVYLVSLNSCTSYNNGWYGYYLTIVDNDGLYKSYLLNNSIAYLNTYGGVYVRANGSLGEIPYLIAIHNNNLAGNNVGQSTGAELGLNSNGGSPYSYARNVSVRGNKIFPSNALTGAITVSGTSPIIENNEIGVVGGTIGVGGGSTGTIIRNNTGYITENSGTATVANGDTTVVVSHGLSVTPTRVQLTATLWSNAAKAWVTTKTATQFTINVDADPGAGTATFDWRAAKREAY